jgi:RNA polymerase sigma-70 factor, ECF subfamily
LPLDDQSRFEGVVREHSGRVLAALIGQFRDFGLAEESLQDAWLLAAEKWPADGWPQRPEGWIYTVAHRRALDRLRRDRTRQQRHESAHQLAALDELAALDRRQERWHSGVEDDRLRLIFTCCHPILDLESRLALTLRSVAWLTTEEIASAFGVPVPTMSQRLVRAKHKIKSEGVPYEVPVGHELPDRLDGVLRVVYLVFNEAYLSHKPDQPIRADLADEAIRLGRLLVELMPDEPEALGLLALMLTQHARASARFDADRDLVLLEAQERDLWDHAMIAEAGGLIETALRRQVLGPYQLQAAIAARHSEAPAWEATDWPEIAALYGLLASIDHSPVVALNRAVAVGFTAGLDAGLAAIDQISADRLPHPHLLHAARAEFLLKLERREEARAAFDQALSLVVSDSERRHLERRHSET